MRRRTLLAAAILSGCAIEMGCSGTGGASGGSGTSLGATESQQAAIKKMEAATGNAWDVSYDTFLGTPYHAAGSTMPLLKRGVSASQATLNFLSENKEVFGMEDPSAELDQVEEAVDEVGWSHAQLKQHVGGVPIYGGTILAHYDQAGALRSVGSHYVRGIRRLDVNPTVTTKDALAIAVRDWKANFQATLDENKDFDRNPTIDLYVYENEGKVALAWFVQAYVVPTDSHDPAKLAYWIDAKTGNVINKYNGLETTTTTGSGTDVNGTMRTLTIDTTSATAFSLTDATRPSKGLVTNNMKNATSGQGTLLTATAATGPWDTSGVGAHFYSEMVYDYYKQVHKRDSMDGAGMKMINCVHYGTKWANASWDGTKMNYGDGDGTQLKNLTGGFDVIAHELTHGVTEHTATYGYTNQVGGLNEGNSDIFGNLAEHWLQPSYSSDIMKNPNLAVGEDIGVTKPLRYMCAPKLGLSAQRDNFGDFVSSDDPHISSGIPNYAWCLMTIGGKHATTGTVVTTGIGWDKSAQIWYLTSSQYLKGMANATFAQAAKANSDAATSLNFTANEKNIITCAWIAVKVSTGTCGDTTGGDGIDGGTTVGDTGTPPPPGDGGTGTTDARTDVSVPPTDANADRGTIDTSIPETTPPPDATTPPDTGTTPDAGTRDATPDTTSTPDATGGSGGSGGMAGTGGSGGATGGTGGTGGATGGTGGTGGTGNAGAGGSTGGTGNRAGSGGSAGSGPGDPGCGCAVPGQSAPVGKSTLALALGFVAAIVSRRRRRDAA